MSTTDAPTPDATGDAPPFRYTAQLADLIEQTWQQRWEVRGTFEAPNPSGDMSEGFEDFVIAPHTFVMDMFPYPSGAGLHVGHPLGYIGTDVYARYRRMKGDNVLHTMGFDAFGLPAEQHAIQTGQPPAENTANNIATFTRQLKRLGLAHDRRRTFATTDADYYRWTQWIFLTVFHSWYDTDIARARPISELVEEFEAGTREPSAATNPSGRPWAELDELERRRVIDAHRLAYRSESTVNWCPGLGTVLANEEVTADGRSERGNFPVFKKPLSQWMMRITAYADRLLDDLAQLDWPDTVRAMQTNWIGRSQGARVRFDVQDRAPQVEVFTTRPDTLFGATYLVLAPEHELVDQLTAGVWPTGTDPVWTGGADTPAAAVAAYREQAASKSEAERTAADKAKTGVFIGTFGVNPVNGNLLPVFIADYVLAGYGTGAIMAVPAEDARDFDFATAYQLPVVRTVLPPEDFQGGAYTGDGARINSGFLDGVEDKASAIAQMVTWLEEHDAGEGAVTYRLRDWLFSRQRYWGEPFPVVFDEHDLPVALPESALPLELPPTTDFRPTTFDPMDADSLPQPPLARLTDWVEVELDLGDGPKKYRRETNTMPNWAGSCWYDLRYLDPRNEERLVDPEIERYWMGPSADRPLGGVDLYVGGVEHAVLHLLYARFWHKVLFDRGFVSSAEPFHRLVNQGMLQAFVYRDADRFAMEAAKVVERDGGFWFEDADAEPVPVTQEIGKIGKSLKNVVTPDEVVAEYGTDTFRLFEMFGGPLEQSRPWDRKAIAGPFRLLQRLWRVAIDEESGESHVGEGPVPDELNRLLHKTIAAVQDGYDTLRFNTSIARITSLNNAVTQEYPEGGAPRALVEPLVLMVAPLAPHIAEELWSRLGHAESLARETFPVLDEAWLVEDTVEMPVQVNGKVRARITVPVDADRDAIEASARADARIAELVGDTEVRRVVVVPGRLVNFVL
ncbi:leucine--tRNA ligase [Jatrophihabitans sp. YIM 134969]